MQAFFVSAARKARRVAGNMNTGRAALPASRQALMARIAKVSDRARAMGALQPIATTCDVLEHEGLHWLLRVVDSLRHKPQPQSERALQRNPFLPYDPALYLANVAPRHVLLLNKYNVIEPHLLLVTATFELQQAPLTVEDFAAALTLLERLDGLVFFNGGRIADLGSCNGRKGDRLGSCPQDN